MKLKPLLTFRANLKEPVEIGAVPLGTRLVIDVTGGEFQGERLRGKIHHSGGDWILIDTDDVGRLDVRLTFETHDEALIYVQYGGVLVFNDATHEALATGGSTQFGDTYLMTHVRFETGDTRYEWLNRIVAVGEGRLDAGVVEYRLYELAND